MTSHYGFTFSVIVEAEGEENATLAARILINKMMLEENVINVRVEDGPDEMIGDEE